MKVAVTTGASQGIGVGLVTAVRRAGYAVVGTSRSIPPCDEPDFLTLHGDIAEPATAERVVRRALERHGRIDSLVNNAHAILYLDQAGFVTGETLHIDRGRGAGH